MDVYQYISGKSPVVISMPHAGQYIPDEISQHMTPEGRSSIDTDWHVQRLYDFAKDMGIYWLQANYSRFVIDLNRSADDENLYPGRNTTQLCPTSTFNEQPIYQSGQHPNPHERENRLANYWQPYHQRLASCLKEVRDQYGYVVLLEAHTIASHVPRFFNGQLPDFNFGTNNGASCKQTLVDSINTLNMDDFSMIIDGVFKGGFITRHYAAPEAGINTLQLELSQATYLEEPSLEWREKYAESCIEQLKQLVTLLLKWQPENTVK